jgi:DnaJ-class molecular chaperone
VTRISETTREVTDITYEGVTYSLVKKGPQSEGRVENCLDCNGRGWMYSRKCKKCHGRGVIRESV